MEEFWLNCSRLTIVEFFHHYWKRLWLNAYENDTNCTTKACKKHFSYLCNFFWLSFRRAPRVLSWGPQNLQDKLSLITKGWVMWNLWCQQLTSLMSRPKVCKHYDIIGHVSNNMYNIVWLYMYAPEKFWKVRCFRNCSIGSAVASCGKCSKQCNSNLFLPSCWSWRKRVYNWNSLVYSGPVAFFQVPGPGSGHHGACGNVYDCIVKILFNSKLLVYHLWVQMVVPKIPKCHSWEIGSNPCVAIFGWLSGMHLLSEQIQVQVIS